MSIEFPCHLVSGDRVSLLFNGHHCEVDFDEAITLVNEEHFRDWVLAHPECVRSGKFELMALLVDRDTALNFRG